MTPMADPPQLAPDLVVEVSVRSLATSLPFYCAFGFELIRRTGGFAVLSWGGRQLFLDEQPALADLVGDERANLRILVPDVDALWQQAQTLGAPIRAPIVDRSYGLRDFTVRDPDGFGLRFASWLTPNPNPNPPAVAG
jgi:catechol 2,3-dioxygenase-like lactoylglutathione lyase family enzyme